MEPQRRSKLRVYNCERKEAGKSGTKSIPRSWDIAAVQWHWEERAAAWDTHNRSLELAEWEERRRSLREREWETAQAGINKVEDMLKVPIMRQTVRDGQTIIEPAKWSFRDAIAILVESSALARKAIGMDDEQLARRQLNSTYDLLRQLLILEEGATIADVKSLVHAHLESVLLQLGKPVPEVRSVLEVSHKPTTD
jgi:hypothetical protein